MSDVVLFPADSPVRTGVRALRGTRDVMDVGKFIVGTAILAEDGRYSVTLTESDGHEPWYSAWCRSIIRSAAGTGRTRLLQDAYEASAMLRHAGATDVEAVDQRDLKPPTTCIDTSVVPLRSEPATGAQAP